MDLEQNPTYVAAEVRELLLCSYLIQRPEVLRIWSDRLAEKHFEYMPAKFIFSLLNHTITKYGTAPTETEMRLLTASANEIVKIETLVINDIVRDIGKVYNQPVTDATGIDLADWITSRELQEIGGWLLTMDPVKAHDYLPELRQKIDKLEGLGGGVTFQPPMSAFAADTLANVENLEEELIGEPLPTGMPRLDYRLQGGFRPREFGLVGGITGSGKSQMLINWGLNMVKMGKRVLYIALDNTKGEISQRVWACSSKIGLDVEKRWASEENRMTLRNSIGGPNDLFLIEEFAPHRLTPSDLRRYIRYVKDLYRRIDLERGVPPEQAGHLEGLLLDYLDLMQPAKSRQKRHEELESLAEDNLAIAKDEYLTSLSVFQINREGMDMATPRLTNMAAAIAKVNCASHCWVYCQTVAEELAGEARLVNYKSRRVHKFYVIPLKVNTKTQEIIEHPDKEVTHVEDAPQGNRGGGKGHHRQDGEATSMGSRADQVQEKFTRSFSALGT